MKSISHFFYLDENKLNRGYFALALFKTAIIVSVASLPLYVWQWANGPIVSLSENHLILIYAVILLLFQTIAVYTVLILAGIRRIKDINDDDSPWRILFIFCPFFNIFYILFLLFKKGTSDPHPREKLILTLYSVFILLTIVWAIYYIAAAPARLTEAGLAQQEKYEAAIKQHDYSDLPDRSALKIKDVVVGTGAEALPGYEVSVLLSIKFADGTAFEDGTGSKNVPLNFILGIIGPFRGIQMGVRGMKVGGERTFEVPQDLGLSVEAYRNIFATTTVPTSTTLYVDAKLVGVNPGAHMHVTEPYYGQP